MNNNCIEFSPGYKQKSESIPPGNEIHILLPYQ